MRRVLYFIVVLFALAISMSATAQDGYKVRYRDIKDIYDYRTYSVSSEDWYSPSLSGIASFLLPGLGQCLCDEWGRGLGIMGANVGFMILGTAEASLAFYGAAESSQHYKNFGEPGDQTLLAVGLISSVVTLLGQTAFNVWNIFDAVKVAKVKNLYYRDLLREPSFALAPSFGITPQACGGSLQPTVGLGLTVTF